mmetsp:Transcript_14761/g.26699  ORF Transcript_14761/g.26699 Transcript_14761/m.26699 type:complete len:92 (-) Transcript_14761:5-280(-)
MADAQIGNQLADTGDQVNLLDGAGGIVDAFAYPVTDASGCGTAAKMNGYTLERKDPFGPSDCAKQATLIPTWFETVIFLLEALLDQRTTFG